MKDKITLSDEDFAVAFKELGPNKLAAQCGCSVRCVFTRRNQVEARLGIKLTPPIAGPEQMQPDKPHIGIDIKNGVVLIGGDGHYWPEIVSTAHRAFVKFAKKLKPRAVIFNGDALDGASISRHPPIGWESLPTLEDELLTVQERLFEIEEAAGKCQRIWTLGNHDARFNMRLAALTPEYRNIQGTRLVHHFPNWEPCWSAEVGGPQGAIVKHRFKGGIHATHNNAMWSGRSMVTGHLHSMKVTPFTDYNGTRWGVDAGCLAACEGPQFNYTENNPKNWRSGFCVLTFKDGELLPPELVTVLDEKKGRIHWRGEVQNV